MGCTLGERQTRYLGSKWIRISFRPSAVTGIKEPALHSVILRPAMGIVHHVRAAGGGWDDVCVGGEARGRWVLLFPHYL